MSPELPIEFLERLRKILGEEDFIRYQETLRAPLWTGVRFNPLVADPGKTRTGLESAGLRMEGVNWCDHAGVVPPEDREALTHHPLVETGAIYVQGLSSILAAILLDPQPGEEVLDLAAAPGGKATHLAALMRNEGRLAVVEPIRKRMYRLADNLKRLGVTIAHTYLSDGRKVGRKVPGRFDRVLLDAPCSGEARIRLETPDSHRFWSLRKIREQSRKQRGLIESAFTCLKPGGTLLYSTCSFAPEENEAIVDHLLGSFPGQADLLDVELPISHWQAGLTRFGETTFAPDVSRTRRILPSSRFDGFYLALIRKRSS